MAWFLHNKSVPHQPTPRIIVQCPFFQYTLARVSLWGWLKVEIWQKIWQLKYATICIVCLYLIIYTSLRSCVT